jgi:alpha-glucosidase
VTWWRGGVFYQIYVRSFADSNGDGIGDLPGLVVKLDYLEWLGIDSIWLNPIHPSPNVDWGYDVADYTDVHPDLGTLADVDRLVEEAGARGIRVLLDLVPNHTSDRHTWFRERPDFYVWEDRVPNNWRAAFGDGPAWTWDEGRGAYYLHLFAPEQPDLDWWNEEVREEFDRILAFWFDRGIAGFRIDVANALVTDRELRDDPPATEADGRWSVARGLAPVYSLNRPEGHEIFRRWRALADRYDPPRVLVGEAWVWHFEPWTAFWGSGDDELHMAFNFRLLDSAFDAESLRAVVEETEAALPLDAWPALAFSNHDVGRLASRCARGDEALGRCALLALLTLRGTPFLYYGDELGLENGVVPDDRLRDVARPSRDPARTPMPWTADGGWTKPWLPLLDTGRNVDDQRDDPDSALAFTRDAIALRRSRPELASGGYESLPSPPRGWAWRRGAEAVAINLGPDEEKVDAGSGRLVLATVRDREGEEVSSAVRLGAHEGVVVDMS